MKRLKSQELSTIVIIPMFLWLLISNLRCNDYIFPQIMIALFVSLIFIICFMRIYAYLRFLRKIDFAKNIKNNIYYAYRYEVVYRRIKMLLYFLLIPVIGLYGRLIYFYNVHDMTLSYLITMFVIACVFIATVSILLYRSVYKNIKTLKESLEELKEFEEMEE